MNEKIEGHCMKCKTKREMTNVEIVEMRPGTKAAKGKCTTCNTGMYKILPKNKAV